MYFSNIGNAELTHFHKTLGADFSMSLTEILSSDLFNVEPIIDGSLYRVYPLFYCKEVISSNSNDRNMDNRCLILEKTNHETYLSFRTNGASDNILINTSILDIKDIKDSLNVNDFNALVYRLRQKGVINGSINFEDNPTSVGVYGTYEISDDDQLRNDTGFIINDKIKNNPLTVTLVNPFFLNAKYTLTFTVRSLTGANVCIEEYEDYTSTDTFSIELIEDTPVQLDVTGYANDSVIDFNVEVSVSFDVAEIVNSNFEVSLTSNHESIYIDESIDLTATLSGEDNVSGYTVQFFEDGTLIGTESTNSEGKAILSDYTSESIGTHVYSCSVLGLSDSVSVSISKHASTITFSSNKSIAYIPTTFTVSGVLSDDAGGIGNTSVKLYNNNTLLDTLTTDNTGAFSKTITANANASYSLKAVYTETASITGAQSNVVNVTARKLNANITINTDRSTVYYSQTITITGVLKDELGNNIRGIVRLYNGDSHVISTTTDSNGAYSFTRSWALGNYAFKVVYDGDGSHVGVTSSTKNVSMVKAPTSFSTSLPSSINVGANLPIKVVSSYGSFNPSSVTVRLYRYNHSSSDQPLKTETLTEKDANGNFNFTIPTYATNNFDIVITYDGDNNYSACSQSGTIRIIEVNVDMILIDRSGNNLIATFYGNMSTIPNTNLTDVTFWLTSRSGVTGSYNLEHATTDNNGKITLTLSDLDRWNGGSVYIMYGDTKSHTLIL